MTEITQPAPEDTAPAKPAWRRRILIVVVAALLCLQFVPIDRSNPPVEADLIAPAEVKSILKRACYDCHSNETKWPWYSYIAPGSWLMAADVKEGRAALNFSEWSNDYDEEDTPEMFQEICWPSIESGEMPLWFYLPLHPESRLSPQDLTVLKEWSGVESDADVAETEQSTKASVADAAE
ncbi:MAG: heme-binding domain-containing protein [Planctomycetaceae bacterium]|nr:heme-binding domain-containing protein [Planctomycetaceae bacterium]